jgi:hypothetical protein
MAYPYIVQDLLAGIGGITAAPTGGVWAKLSQRADVFTFGPQWIADAVLELSQSYPFQGLQRSTATPVQLTNGVFIYPFSTWVNPGDIPIPVNSFNANPKLIPSFFMFYQNPLNPVTGYNPGIGLTYKTIDSLELMFSTPGTPAYWTRYQNQVFIAPQPNQNFFSYMRYQIQHPFSQPASLNDVIELDDDWREIIEYSAALRGATNFRMLDYASQYHNILYGDPKKQGDVGLIAARVSQNENDIVSNQGMRQIRPMNWRR